MGLKNMNALLRSGYQEDNTKFENAKGYDHSLLENCIPYFVFQANDEPMAIGYGWNLDSHTWGATCCAMLAIGVPLTVDQITILMGYKENIPVDFNIDGESVCRVPSKNDMRVVWKDFYLTENQSRDLFKYEILTRSNSVYRSLIDGYGSPFLRGYLSSFFLNNHKDISEQDRISFLKEEVDCFLDILKKIERKNYRSSANHLISSNVLEKSGPESELRPTDIIRLRSSPDAMKLRFFLPWLTTLKGYYLNKTTEGFVFNRSLFFRSLEEIFTVFLMSLENMKSQSSMPLGAERPHTGGEHPLPILNLDMNYLDIFLSKNIANDECHYSFWLIYISTATGSEWLAVIPPLPPNVLCNGACAVRTLEEEERIVRSLVIQYLG